jgi:hypothetical protein
MARLSGCRSFFLIQALVQPPDSECVPKTAYAIGFSQWLMTKFSERQIYLAKNRMARILLCRENSSSGRAGA